MFFSKIDREEFEVLKKDLLSLSQDAAHLTKRIEDMEMVVRRLIVRIQRIEKLQGKRGAKK